MHLAYLLVGLLAAGSEETAKRTAEKTAEKKEDDTRVEAWAGHQVLKGARKIPIYGNKETHTENFVIAEVHRNGKHIDVLQKICRIAVQPIKGVTASMRRETVLRLPKSRFSIDVDPNGSLVAAAWTTGWGKEDVDADGHPGATINISGSTCAGDVYVSNQTTSRILSGRASEDGITGTMSSQVRQEIFGASGICLKLMAGDSVENQTGWFAYRRTPIGISCRSLATQPWPVHAVPPTSSSKQ